MPISLSATGISQRRIDDFVLSELVLTQSGKHIKKTFSQKPSYRITVAFYAQTGDNADLAQWRFFLTTAISFKGSTYICPDGLQITYLHDRNDNDDNAIKNISFTLIKQEN
jgi:hypothetical protein